MSVTLSAAKGLARRAGDMAGARGHGDRKGRHYYTRTGISVVYSSGGACPRHALAVAMPCAQGDKGDYS